ncbi:MAG: glycoside hydrolase domain-containing protein [Lentisphaeria bacterium]
MKKMFFSFFFLIGCCCQAGLSEGTLLRLAPMPQSPQIDGKITLDEWTYASTTFGGISNKSGLMTARKNNFRFGYDQHFIYFALTSEMPIPPQKLTAEDLVEWTILPPHAEQPFVIRLSPEESANLLPVGAKVAHGVATDLISSNRGTCWTVEAAIPLAALKINELTDGQKWGIQMARHWSSEVEIGYWHQPKSEGELGTFIPDTKAPQVSFDGFGYWEYEATGNYVWSYRAENSTGQPLNLVSGCYMVGIEGAPTLDIENPDLIGKERKKPIGGKFSLAAGETEEFTLYQMAQFPGKPRLLYSLVQDTSTNTVFYTRAMFWDVSMAKKTATWKDNLGLPYLCAGFYPSYGNLLRVAAVFNSKLPCLRAVITVSDANGKVWKTFDHSDFGRAIADFEDSEVLPDLPLGEYVVSMVSTAENKQQYTHERTFAIRTFPWQGLKIGEERVIIPPFKPLVVKEGKKEVHALLTGYQLGGGLWKEVFAEGENILAAPIEFRLNGKSFSDAKIKLLSKEPDRVVYQTSVSGESVTLELRHEYDYDGFCKVFLKVIPDGKVDVQSFQLLLPLRDQFVQFYNPLDKAGNRATGAPSLAVPEGEGVLTLPAVCTRNGHLERYFWFGGQYKGICWMIENERNFSLAADREAQRLSRKGEIVTYTIDIVNHPVTWETPFEIVMGFQATPVKPQPEGYRKVGGFMYDYPPPQGGDHAGMAGTSNLANALYYPIGTVPNGDMSFYDFLMQSRNNSPSETERREFGDAYFARNVSWIKKNMPMLDLRVLRRNLIDKRQYGKKYFLLYHNPALYSFRWPEAEMYKAEWLPWDYPVDDASNEYVATHTKEYIDKLLYEMRNQARLGYDGMNFDCFPLGGGCNTVIGAGVRVKPGKVPFIHNQNMLSIAPPGISSGTRLFSWRELCKRTATMLYLENKLVYGRPWVELHATHAQCVPVTAFCSTTITWERGSGGGIYQNRFPESYILADIVGTQSGIIPRVIVSTRGAMEDISKAEEVKTLIATSFGFAIMNHCDQGVERGHKEYAFARDTIFSFGYGDPSVQIYPFWGKEPQPVRCSAPDIRLTSVVRPDGKTLLLIGNLGEEVRVNLDLSGLRYSRFTATDLYSGNVFEPSTNPVIEIAQHGYALLKVEKLP